MKKVTFIISVLLSLACYIPLTLKAQSIQFGAGLGASYYKSNRAFASIDMADPYGAFDYDFFVRWQPKGKWALEIGFGDYLHRKYDETYTADWEDETGTDYTNYVHQKTTVLDHQWDFSLQYKLYSAAKFNAYIGCSFTIFSENINESETWYHISAPNTIYTSEGDAHVTYPYYGALIKCTYNMPHSWILFATLRYRTKWNMGYPLYSSGDKDVFSTHTTPNAFYTLNFGISYNYRYSRHK